MGACACGGRGGWAAGRGPHLPSGHLPASACCSRPLPCECRHTAPRGGGTWGTGRVFPRDSPHCAPARALGGLGGDFTRDSLHCAPAGGHLGDWEGLHGGRSILRPGRGALGGLGASSLGRVHAAPWPEHLGDWGGLPRGRPWTITASMGEAWSCRRTSCGLSVTVPREDLLPATREENSHRRPDALLSVLQTLLHLHDNLFTGATAVLSDPEETEAQSESSDFCSDPQGRDRSSGPGLARGHHRELLSPHQALTTLWRVLSSTASEAGTVDGPAAASET